MKIGQTVYWSFQEAGENAQLHSGEVISFDTETVSISYWVGMQNTIVFRSTDEVSETDPSIQELPL